MRTMLARKADRLANRLYCSLPFGYRLARVLVKISMETREILGRVALAEMIKSNVTEIPAIKGKPASEYTEAVKRRGADALPRGSGSDLGGKVFSIAQRKYSKTNLVEDALAQVMIQMVQNRNFFVEGSTYKESERRLIQSVLNRIVDDLRHINRSPVKDVGELDLERIGPKDFEHLDRVLNGIQLRKLMGQLHKVHPKALEWFQAQLEGRKNKELAEMWGVSEPRVHQLVSRFLPQIRALITDAIEDVQEAV